MSEGDTFTSTSIEGIGGIGGIGAVTTATESNRRASAAAEQSLLLKRKGHGAHTGWSAAWDSCLWARLGRGDRAVKSLSHLLMSYSATNLMALHPDLQKV